MRRYIEICVQGKEQIEAVQTAEMNSPVVEDSFARLNYHQESEIGVNQQIKCATQPLPTVSSLAARQHSAVRLDSGSHECRPILFCQQQPCKCLSHISLKLCIVYCGSARVIP